MIQFLTNLFTFCQINLYSILSMSSFREIVAKTIHEQRPKLSISSLKTYVSTLVNLHKKLANSDENIDWFKTNSKEILEYLHDTPPKQRKSILAALYVLTNEAVFRALMISDCKTTNDEYKDQKKDVKESANWIEPSEIQRIYDDLKTKVENMFKHKLILQTSTIVEFFCLAFLGGISGLPPRRSMDYCLLKCRNFDPKKDNFFKAGKLYFNQYKTAAKYGCQTLEVPVFLQKLMKKWMKLNTSDYFLVSTNNKPLTSPQISRMLNKVFGKHVSTDMLRHIFLTKLFKDMPAVRDLEKLASEMGHSVSQQMLYVKKN